MLPGSGVCWGSRHLPFEKDISLIKGAIQRATERAAELRKEAAKWRSSTDPNNVINQLYLDYNEVRQHRLGLRGGYFSFSGKLELRSIVRPDYSYEEVWFHPDNAIQKPKKVETYGMTGDLLSRVVKQLNEQQASRIESVVKQAEDYVAWQIKRIEGWKPSALKPVKS